MKKRKQLICDLRKGIEVQVLFPIQLHMVVYCSHRKSSLTVKSGLRFKFQFTVHFTSINILFLNSTISSYAIYASSKGARMELRHSH